MKNLFFLSQHIMARISLSFTQIKTFSTIGLRNNETTVLNPYYISGLVDGEGTFSVSIFKDAKSKLGWRAGLQFKVQLHAKDKALLEQFRAYFGVGNIHVDSRDGSLQFSVKSLKEITNNIIPHFLQYPLITQK